MGICHSRESDTQHPSAEEAPRPCKEPWNPQVVASAEESTQLVAEPRQIVDLHPQTGQAQPRSNGKVEEVPLPQLDFPAEDNSSVIARLNHEHIEAEAIIASQRETIAGLEANIKKQKQIIDCHENTISSQKTAVQGYALQVSAMERTREENYRALERTREENDRALDDKRALLETHAEATSTHRSTVERLQATIESQQQIIEGHELTIQNQMKGVENHATEMAVLRQAIDERKRALAEREAEGRVGAGLSEASETALKVKQDAIAALERERDRLRGAVKTKDSVIADLRLIGVAQQKAKAGQAPAHTTCVSAARAEEMQKKIASLESANDILCQQISTLKLTAAGVSDQASARHDLSAGRFERDRMAALLTTREGGVRWDGWKGKGFAFDPMDQR